MCKSSTVDRYADIKEKLRGYAATDKDIRAVVAIGSSTRDDVPSDEYSDLDLIIATAAPEKWFSGEYPDLLGKVEISFIEPTLGGGKERRCIYDSYRDVDMIVFTPEQFDRALEEGVAEWVMNRGYKFLYDADDYAGRAEKYVRREVRGPEMSEEEFVNTVNDFYFHNIWAYKKLRRGELWSAKMCIDSYLKTRLLSIIEQYHKLGGADVWHDGRFIDRWAERSVTEELKRCFAHYDTEDCISALRATHVLFARLASAVAEKRGFRYPAKAGKCAAEYLEQ